MRYGMHAMGPALREARMLSMERGYGWVHLCRDGMLEVVSGGEPVVGGTSATGMIEVCSYVRGKMVRENFAGLPDVGGVWFSDADRTRLAQIIGPVRDEEENKLFTRVMGSA